MTEAAVKTRAVGVFDVVVEVGDVDDDCVFEDDPAALIVEVGYSSVRSCGGSALNVSSVGEEQLLSPFGLVEQQRHILSLGS